VVIVLLWPAKKGAGGIVAVAAHTPAAGAASPAPESPEHGEEEHEGDIPDDDDPTGPRALILVTAVGRTDPGLKRAQNEDAYAILEDHHLFLIADGMGRHAAGEVASKLCVDAITDAFRASSFGAEEAKSKSRRAGRLRGAIAIANERVYRESQEKDEYAGMGTTVVGAYFSQNNQRVYVAHVGDSRCYRLRAGELTQLTMDHTLGNAGIAGRTASVLSRAVGIEPEVEVDVAVEAPLPGDVYLLCSDGLSRSVSDGDLRQTLSTLSDLEKASSALIDKAKDNGGRDNITAILVRVDAAP
jgi:protein phosphatase